MVKMEVVVCFFFFAKMCIDSDLPLILFNLEKGKFKNQRQKCLKIHVRHLILTKITLLRR